MDLKEKFIKNCFQFSEDQDLIESLWQEIEKRYSEKGRYYHTLKHLESMLSELEMVRGRISNFTNISFSVFYHDIVYDATSKLNEEKSAEFAVARLEKLSADKETVKNVFEQILTTKLHQKSDDNDINYLLDADLSILGKDPEIYLEYTKKIRKEYSFYPDLLYKPGRKKVLQNFLGPGNIFKTEYFQAHYEKLARMNIESELKSL